MFILSFVLPGIGIGPCRALYNYSSDVNAASCYDYARCHFSTVQLHPKYYDLMKFNTPKQFNLANTNSSRILHTQGTTLIHLLKIEYNRLYQPRPHSPSNGFPDSIRWNNSALLHPPTPRFSWPVIPHQAPAKLLQSWNNSAAGTCRIFTITSV